VLFGSSLFGIFAAIYFWYPKMFGRMMSEKLGVIHFWLTFIFFNLCFFPMHILGLSGFPRRIADYLHYQTYNQYQPMNQFISYAAFALGIAQIFFVINFIGSWFFGKKAPNNPWLCSTLEWETPALRPTEILKRRRSSTTGHMNMRRRWSKRTGSRRRGGSTAPTSWRARGIELTGRWKLDVERWTFAFKFELPTCNAQRPTSNAET